MLGREIVATIANLREVSWGTLGLNFTVIFAPGALDGAPQTHIAAAQAAPEAEEPLLGAVTQRFANITAIRVREALAAAGELLGGIALAVRATALVMLVAGLLVLSGTIAAGHRRRVYDSVILKVLGARRADVWRAHLIENALLGGATATVAVVAGTVAGWAVVRGVMDADWVFAPSAAALTAALGVSATALFGFLCTYRALGHPAGQSCAPGRSQRRACSRRRLLKPTRPASATASSEAGARIPAEMAGRMCGSGLMTCACANADCRAWDHGPIRLQGHTPLRVSPAHRSTPTPRHGIMAKHGCRAVGYQRRPSHEGP